MTWDYRQIVVVGILVSLSMISGYGEDFTPAWALYPRILVQQETSSQQAETRILRFERLGDISALAHYARQLVDHARKQQAFIDDLIEERNIYREDQKRYWKIIAEMESDFRNALTKERTARDALVNLLQNANKRGWRQYFSSGAAGATVGAATGQNGIFGLVGGAIGIGIEFIVQKGK